MSDKQFKAVLILGFIAALLLVFAGGALAQDSAQKHKNETKISGAWCETRGGIAEFRLQDGARIDCYLPNEGFAVEHDWGHGGKNYECAGQALFYAAETGLLPMCVLIKKTGQPAADFAKHARRAIIAGALVNGGMRVECITEEDKHVDCLTGE